MVVRHRLPGTLSRRNEHWTAHTEADLLAEFDIELALYPQTSYDTTLSVRPDPTGLIWHATFSRRSSAEMS